MRRITFSIIIVILISLPVFCKDDPSFYDSYDLAPWATPGPSQPSDEQWDIIYAWEDMESQSGDNGLLGICFDGDYLWVSGRGVGADNMMYMFDPATGLLVDSWPTGTTSAWGIRDMCTDWEYIYGGEDGGLRQFDMTTHVLTGTIPIPTGMSFQRANAYDPSTDHFYCGNFGVTCYEQDREGNLIRTWAPAPLTAIYGMAWDADAPDGPWLWVLDPVNPMLGCNIHQLDPVTLTYTGYWVNIPTIGSGSGMHYCGGVYPICTTMLLMSQGVGYALEMYLGGTPPFPAAPSDFTISANGADLSANLNWINPSMSVTGEPLDDLDGIMIERDGELIADITDVQIGEPSAYIDEDIPAAGLYSYEVFGYNDWGWGAPTWGSAWIGPDVPGAPGNFVVTPDPGGALENTLTWDAPTAGAHGGYFSGTDSYNIYRAPMGSPLVLEAELITGTSYVDEVIFTGWYDYGVAGVNGSGEGEMAVYPEAVYTGIPEFEQIPYDWFEIAHIGTNTGITGDDQNLGPFEMGIIFPWYNGNNYSTIRVCSNGFFSFTSTSSAYSNAAIPSTDEPNDVVAPYWDDLYPPDGGNIWYFFDIANDRFIIEFEDINHISGTDGYYFQTIFYSDGNIDFMYQHIGDVLNSCTVGKENGEGTQGVQVTYNGSGPWEPQSQTGIRMYYQLPPPEEPHIYLTPYGTPIIIPAGGGEFDFNISGMCASSFVMYWDIWTDILLPNASTFGPIINVDELPMLPYVIYERDRTQAVPANAPTGNYNYGAYIGIYPSFIMDEDHFIFEKSAAGDGIGYDDWYNWGEAFQGEVLNAPDVPSDYSLSEAYPNPFNPAVHIGYSLPERAQVELIVYDVSGREVTSLVKGWKDAGSYQVTFDGGGMASGVYFYRLKAGDFSEVKKMVLVK